MFDWMRGLPSKGNDKKPLVSKDNQSLEKLDKNKVEDFVSLPEARTQQFDSRLKKLEEGLPREVRKINQTQINIVIGVVIAAILIVLGALATLVHDNSISKRNYDQGVEALNKQHF